MAKGPSVFIPIYKVDTVQRLVYGRITDETPDMAGEICDYESSAPLFRAWSDRAVKATEAAGVETSFGNVRVMHGLKAAGKLTEISFDDAAKSIDCCAYIHDDAEWDGVLKGVYTGFSLGGKYVGKKWKDAVTQKTRYTVDPFEASLVDLPCNPNSGFVAVKADGAEEEIMFKVSAHTAGDDEPAPAEETASAGDDAPAAEKAAGDPDAASDGWVPDNGAIIAKAAELRAAGPDATVDFVALARGELIKAHNAEIAPPAAEEPPVAEKAADPADDAPAAEANPEAEPAADAAAEKAETNLAELMAIDQVWRTADGKTHAKKGDAAEHAATLVIAAKAGGDPLAQALARAQAAIKAPGADADPAAFDSDHLSDLGHALKYLGDLHAEHVATKGLYEVRSLASLIQELSWLTSSAISERKYEGDGSTIPDALAQSLAALGHTLVDMAREEVTELLGDIERMGVSVDIVVGSGMFEFAAQAARAIDAVKADEALVTKVGARNSGKDMTKIQGVHDNAVLLGAACKPGEAASKGAGATPGPDDLESLKAANAALQTRLDDTAAQVDAIAAGYETTLKAMQDKVDAWANTPEPAAPSRGVVVEKGFENGGLGALNGAGSPQEIMTELLKTHTPQELALLCIKAAQQQPMTMTPGIG